VTKQAAHDGMPRVPNVKKTAELLAGVQIEVTPERDFLALLYS
jgi:hypothetical protein